MSIMESSEFKKALAEECERQYRGFMYGGDIPKGAVGTTEEEIQRQRREIEEKVADARAHAERVRAEARIMSDPAMREITENLRRMHAPPSGLVCPSCGETNSHGNRMGKAPYCFKCNLPFMSREKAEKWIKPSQPKKFQVRFDEPDGVVRVRK